MIRLENWSMLDGNPYLADEIKEGFLLGSVYGHSEFEDGEQIVTSCIIEINVRRGLAKTSSGSEYILGRPHPEWVLWLKENNFTQTVEDLKSCENRIMN